MKRTGWLAGLATLSIVMSGCAALAPAGEGGSEPSPGSPASSSPATHTMADGTVMSGAEHEAGHEAEAEAGHESGQSAKLAARQPSGAARQPSGAARMVCNGQVVENVAGIFGMDEALIPSSSWDQPEFTCTYDLESGPLVLTVHDATDAGMGMAYYESLRKSLGSPEEFKGLYGLGRPGFSTGEGKVAFITDGKTLEVDATALRGTLGGNEEMSPSDAAYSVATAVLACWIEHAGHE